MDAVGLRIQRLGLGDQVLVLARLAQNRSEAGRFATSDINQLFDDSGLPRPGNTSDVLGRLRKGSLVTRLNERGSWRLTPEGTQRSLDLIGDMDLTVLAAETTVNSGAQLGASVHPVIPPTLAPPQLLRPLQAFLEAHPFDTNVFGMMRFPDSDDGRPPDPVAAGVQAARKVCELHGLEFHLASDRAIVDDLWGNVTAHMWASRYGIAFFEDTRDRGLNYNLTIEVGGMLMSGRRCALVKDQSIARMPTDLVGHIYKSVDLTSEDEVALALHGWFRDDLGMGRCGSCPEAEAA